MTNPIYQNLSLFSSSIESARGDLSSELDSKNSDLFAAKKELPKFIADEGKGIANQISRIEMDRIARKVGSKSNLLLLLMLLIFLRRDSDDNMRLSGYGDLSEWLKDRVSEMNGVMADWSKKEKATHPAYTTITNSLKQIAGAITEQSQVVSPMISQVSNQIKPGNNVLNKYLTDDVVNPIKNIVSRFRAA